MTRGRELPKAWRPLPLLGLWLLAGVALSAVTGHVRDWFDMTDELRYERLAISIARSHSLVPRIHGVDVQSFSQLYPLLIAPIFAHGTAPHDVHAAHVLNAWIMTSACIPAYLLARRVLARRWSYLVALLSVLMPWIIYSTMLMTEVAAYPAFLWGLYAIHRTTVRPSVRADVIALLGLALAFSGRTELLVLVFVPPPAIAAYEIGRATGSDRVARLKAGLGNAVSAHRLLSATYVVLVVAGIAADLAGKLSGVVGVYGVYAQNNTLFPAGMIGSLATHVAVLAMGLGVLPFLLGAAWLLAGIARPDGSAERHALACTSGFAMLAVIFQGTNFDVRYTGFVHDRFLLYLTPPILIAMCCALEAPRRLRFALGFVTAVAICGFATGSFPMFTWKQFPTLTQDSPMSGILRAIVNVVGSLTAARVSLAIATGVLAVGFALLALRVRPARLAPAVAAFAVLTMSVVTVETFSHFFRVNGWSGRPVTSSQVDAFDWIDQAAGPRASVAEIPYLVSSDYFISEGTWRDLEFWNKSVVRDVLDPGGDAYAYTGIWFPKLDLSLDPTTGRANMSPTSLIAVSDKDTRFQLAGEGIGSSGDIRLVRAAMPWRAQWISFGLYDDGWTKPGVTARFRIFPSPGQTHAEIRVFAFAVHPADGVTSQPVHLVSNLARWSGNASDTGTIVSQLKVCVPASGYTEIRVSTPRSVEIPVEQSEPSTQSRRGGVFFGETALADEVDGRCGS